MAVNLFRGPSTGLDNRLQGGGFRIRTGDYRVVYLEDDVARIVTITNVGHRKGVYRGR